MVEILDPDRVRTVDCLDGTRTIDFEVPAESVVPWRNALAVERALKMAGIWLVRHGGSYDCVSLALGKRLGLLLTSADSKLDYPQSWDDTVRKALEADGYLKFNPDDPLRAGDVVIYSHDAGISHVAVATGITKPIVPGGANQLDVLLSKFGELGGEFLHVASAVPAEYGAISEYWRQDLEG